MGKVLIVKFGAIGDVVMALPAVRGLYDREGGRHRIDWVCGPTAAPLLECYPWIRTIVADDRAILKGAASDRLGALLGLWRAIGWARYDLCATLYYDALYRVVTLPVRADRKIQLSRSERERRLLGARHHCDEYARVLLGEVDSCRSTSLAPLRPERLPECSLAAAQAVRVGIVPG